MAFLDLQHLFSLYIEESHFICCLFMLTIASKDWSVTLTFNKATLCEITWKLAFQHHSLKNHPSWNQSTSFYFIWLQILYCLMYALLCTHQIFKCSLLRYKCGCHSDVWWGAGCQQNIHIFSLHHMEWMWQIIHKTKNFLGPLLATVLG